jgi:hypothetical protein
MKLPSLVESALVNIVYACADVQEMWQLYHIELYCATQ